MIVQQHRRVVHGLVKRDKQVQTRTRIAQTCQPPLRIRTRRGNDKQHGHAPRIPGLERWHHEDGDCLSRQGTPPWRAPCPYKFPNWTKLTTNTHTRTHAHTTNKHTNIVTNTHQGRHERFVTTPTPHSTLTSSRKTPQTLATTRIPPSEA